MPSFSFSFSCLSSKHIDKDSAPVITRREPRQGSLPPYNPALSRNPPAYVDMKYTSTSDSSPILTEPSGVNDPEAAIRKDAVKQLSNEFNADPKNRMVQNAAHSVDFTTLITNRDVMIADNHVFNTKIPIESLVTNQKSSGRCWIFAGLNVFRIEVMKKYNLEEFELSQGYLFFWDKFEKCNWFLESMIDLRERNVNDRVVQHLLKEPISDGGQWDMFVNLVKRYGVVPKAFYPESFCSSNTSKLNGLILSKLRDYAALLRRLSEQGFSVQNLRDEKEKCLKEIYDILAITLGEPPKKPFTWTFRNKDKNYFEFSDLTPQVYFREHVGYQVEDTVSLINDPRNPTHALYTVQYLGNISGGRPIRYINAPVESLKELAIKKLKSGKPVWFGADVGKYLHREGGILDPKVFQYDLAFNLKFTMNKAERLLHGDSLMTHAMVFTGVHLDESGNPVRWRVENSWGDVGGDKGYLTMSDAWFSEFVYQIVIEKDITPQEFLDVLEQEVQVLPAYDPMGALA
ncbi:hypothetical protein BGW38_003084 [Lunasporangiospora selenospora]|uniref:Cysteine proteinase 1, mitochondrial n=1 Tax=Lunasporangiospora selenospora TaxID=979761 RepID=A0A9P6G1W3_9FUNG|nr:hypothetical protein BGW38_003084 [Lunasporangiospora selenospora]